MHPFNIVPSIHIHNNQNPINTIYIKLVPANPIFTNPIPTNPIPRKSFLINPIWAIPIYTQLVVTNPIAVNLISNYLNPTKPFPLKSVPTKPIPTKLIFQQTDLISVSRPDNDLLSFLFLSTLARNMATGQQSAPASRVVKIHYRDYISIATCNVMRYVQKWSSVCSAKLKT